MLQEHVAAKCSEDKIALSAHCRKGHVARLCSRDMQQGPNCRVCILVKKLPGRVSGKCWSDTSSRVRWHFFTRATGNLCKICPSNMSHGVQLVELHGTCCRGKFFTNFMLRGWKRASAQERMCRCNVSLKHVLATFHKCANSAISSLLHFLATQPCKMSRQCVLDAILSSLHFAATCSCNISPRVGPP